jgi:hypothetical protein
MRTGQVGKRTNNGLNNNKDKKVAKRFIICACIAKDFTTIFPKPALNSAFSTELSLLYNLFRPMVVHVEVQKGKFSNKEWFTWSGLMKTASGRGQPQIQDHEFRKRYAGNGPDLRPGFQSW